MDIKEKLDIKPVNLGNIKFTKNSLREFYIVRVKDDTPEYYIVLKSPSLIKLCEISDRNKNDITEHGMIYSYTDSQAYLQLSRYKDNLHYDNEYDRYFTITEVYAPKRADLFGIPATKNELRSVFGENNLKKLIDDGGYALVYMNEK